MILSHQHRFIYIRCRKTASTSIELALSQVCGPRDILTAMFPDAEESRRQAGGRGPQGHLNPDGTARFYSHMPAAEVRLLVGEDVWNSYFTWCVERNPWEKVVSHYFNRHRHPATRPSFETFLEAGAAHWVVNFRLYTVGAEVVVDHVARYENLAEELRMIAARVGLPAEVAQLPRANARRPDDGHYSAYYTPVARDFVSELFAYEIALHGYRFEDLAGGELPR